MVLGNSFNITIKLLFRIWFRKCFLLQYFYFRSIIQFDVFKFKNGQVIWTTLRPKICPLLKWRTFWIFSMRHTTIGLAISVKNFSLSKVGISGILVRSPAFYCTKFSTYFFKYFNHKTGALWPKQIGRGQDRRNRKLCKFQIVRIFLEKRDENELALVVFSSSKDRNIFNDLTTFVKFKNSILKHITSQIKPFNRCDLS